MAAIAATLMMAACSNSEKYSNENPGIPTEEELLGTWISDADFQKIDGKWEKIPIDPNLQTQYLIFGPNGHLVSAYTSLNKDLKVSDFNNWSIDKKTGDLAISGEISGRAGEIDKNDILSIYTDVEYDPETKKEQKGEFVSKYKRAMPANRLFVGSWEYVATYKNDDEQKDGVTVKWNKYPLGVPDRIVITATEDGQQFTISTYKEETQKSGNASFNIDSKTGEYTVQDKYQGRILFMNDDVVWWYQDKVKDFPSGEITEGKFRTEFKRVKE